MRQHSATNMILWITLRHSLWYKIGDSVKSSLWINTELPLMKLLAPINHKINDELAGK